MTRTCDLGKLEIGGQFLADAGDSLGGGVYGQQLGLPVGHHAVRFQRGMGLHLGVVTRIHHHVGVFESLLGVAVFAYRRPVNIACLGNTVRASSSSRGCGLIGRSGENLGCVGFPSLVHIDDEGHGFVLHLDLGCGFFRCLGSGGRDGGNRLPGIAHDGIFRNIERRVAQDGGAKGCFHHVHALDPGRILGCGSVDGENLCVRHCGVDEAGVEHARQLHVGGIAGAAGDFGVTIPALGRFADVVEVFVDRQHWRLRGRYGALFHVQGIAGDADGHTDSLFRSAEPSAAAAKRGSGTRCVVSVAMVVSPTPCGSSGWLRRGWRRKFWGKCRSGRCCRRRRSARRLQWDGDCSRAAKRSS